MLKVEVFRATSAGHQWPSKEASPPMRSGSFRVRWLLERALEFRAWLVQVHSICSHRCELSQEARMYAKELWIVVVEGGPGGVEITTKSAQGLFEKYANEARSQT